MKRKGVRLGIFFVFTLETPTSSLSLCQNMGMSLTFEQKLGHYAGLAVNVGLGVRAGQRLIVIAPIATAPLVRLVTARAYDAGATFVDVFWSDDAINLTRFEKAPKDSFTHYPAWEGQALLEAGQRGDPVLMIRASDPDLLKNADADSIASAQKALRQVWKPYDELRLGDASAWCIMVAPIPSWSAKVLPDVPESERERAMWELLFATTRADQSDPVAAWKTHLERLQTSSAALNARTFRALKFRGPGTDLEVGLPSAHIWKSGASRTRHGVTYVANIPTEEVFTLPHRERVEGFVSSTKPLNYGGRLIENIRVEFKAGQIVNATASTGQETLIKLLDTDAGSRRLGEVALVPHSSPISQSGRVFYHTLFDENAASHIAIGKAYKDCLKNAQTMNESELEAAGVNTSLMHVDWMIGSGQVSVDGVNADGSLESVMRDGEWTLG